MILTYKVYWKNGNSELMMGRDLADALNQRGYACLNELEGLESWSEVSFPDKEQILEGEFSCVACKGPMVVTQLGEGQFVACCQDCGDPTAVVESLSTSEEAIWDWNAKQVQLQLELISTSPELQA